MLAETVAAGATEIKLQVPVTWSVGDEIVIASTGGHTSQKENEKCTIASVSSDQMTLTLTKALEYDHLGETQTFEGGITLETRAEVGLLTHNVVVRGSNLKDWNDKIEACPDGFDPGKLQCLVFNFCKTVCIISAVWLTANICMVKVYVWMMWT